MTSKVLEFHRPGSPVPQDSHERDLILEAQHGDHSAFHKLYDLHRDKIYSLLYYLLKERSAADDMLQAVFLKIFRNLNSYRFEASFLTWACHIAMNEFRNDRKRHRVLLPLSLITGTGKEIDDSPGPQEREQVVQSQMIVRRAILALKPAFRAVIVLKYVEGLSYEQMSVVLGCSTGTIASRLNRALEAMESQLAAYPKLF